MNVKRTKNRPIAGPSAGSEPALNEVKGQALGLSLALAALLFLALGLTATSTGLAARPERVRADLQNCVPGPHNGTLVVSQTWCLGDSPHVLNGDVTVNAGVVLTVEAEVTVQAYDNVEFKMLGRLEAVGTVTQPITFTSVTDSGAWQWSGLLFDGAAASGNLEQTTVRYTGDSNSLGLNAPALLVRNVTPGQVRIADSRVVDNRKGLWLIDSRATVSHTLFSGVADANQYPLEIQGAGSVVTLTANTFTANPRNRVLLQPGAMMAADATLTPQTGLDGYELANDFTVPAGRTLTVAPGVTVMADGGRELKMLGRLEAVGTPTQPITFTSVTDSGGQQWTGLVFDGGAGHLDYATVRYGGNGNSVGLEAAGLVARNVTAGEVRLEHTSLITACGFVVQDSRMSFISSTLSGNGGLGCSNFVGMYLGGSGTVFTMTHSLFQNNGGLIVVWYGNVRATFDHNRFIDNESTAYNGHVLHIAQGWEATTSITLTNNLFQGNSNALHFASAGTATLINNVFIGQTGTVWPTGSALEIAGNLTAIHNTFAHNRSVCKPPWCEGDAIFIYNWHEPEPYRIVFTDTIIADHKTGVLVCAGPVRMDHTLWYSNTVNMRLDHPDCEGGGGVLTETGHLEGPAAFAADGYHLTCDSVALQAGLDAGVSDDIDGEARPQPSGTMPDLGADESPCAVVSEFTALKSALPPQWIVTPDPGAPAGYRGQVRQRYTVSYHYHSSPIPLPALAVAVTDTLPAELTFAAEEHQPAMDFQQQGQQLTWRTLSPVQAGEFGWLWLEGIDDDPQAGEILRNTAELQAGDRHFDLEASSTVPLFAPLLVSPQNGETCIGPVLARGLAQPGVTVQVLDAANTVITETVADAGGAFTATFFYPSDAPWVIKARACAGGPCSASSQPVTLTPQQSFWCPQDTFWQAGNYGFWLRGQDGWLTTQHFVLPSLPIYNVTTTLGIMVSTNWPAGSKALGLQGCASDPMVWMTLDGEGAMLIDKRQVNFWSIYWEFAPLFGGVNPREVCIKAWCEDPYTYEETCGYRKLIDPDGYIFDVTQGLDVGVTTVAGVTVTCLMSSTEWGGWVPWPAHWYGQKNPQVTGDNGYFAFFTPPGHYYVQVEGIPGYQAWRSPAVEVISEIVHVNVPYTPWPVEQGANLLYTVTLTADGPDPALLTVPAGSSVAWVSTLRDTDDADDLVRWTENPILRPLSALDPISHTLGWDGGMMAPGRVYRRQFPVAGSYAYSDGAGHGGTVVVRGYVYLPLVMRRH